MIEMILQYGDQYSNQWQFSLALLFLQIAVLVLAAGLLNRVLKNNPQQRHFVWVASLVAAALIIPLQWNVPSWKFEVARETSYATVEDSVVAASVDKDFAVNPVVESNETVSLSRPADHHSPREMDSTIDGTDLPASTSPLVGVADVSVSGFSILKWLWLAYLATVGLLMLRLCFAWRRLSLIRASENIAPEVSKVADEVAARIGLRRSPALMLSEKIQTPMALGILRPRVVLPTTFTSWPTECQRIVLAHEMSHVARRDALSDLIAQLISIVYWFHPAVHIAKRALRQNRELATDQAVLNMGFAPVDYARELLNVASGQIDQPRGYGHVAVGVPMAGEQDLAQRIKQVLQSDRPKQKRANRWLQVGVVLAFLTLASFSFQITSVAVSPVSKNASNATMVSQEAQDVKEKPNLKTYQHIRGDSFYSRVIQVEPSKKYTSKTGIKISGTVTDRDDNPVANEIVIVRNDISMSASKGNKINDVMMKTRTDEKGSFRFENVQITGQYVFPQIVVLTEGGEMAWSDSIYPSRAALAQNMKLKLEPSTEYKGIIVDVDGAPVSGANVQVAFFRRLDKTKRGMESVGFNDRAISPSVVTDVDGKFRFPALPKNIAIALDTRHPDFPKNYTYVSGSDAVIASVPNWSYESDVKVWSSDSKIVLQPGLELEGKVVDKNEQPVADVVCELVGQESDLTGADGKFRLLLNENWLNTPNRTRKFELTARHKDFAVTTKEFSRVEIRKGDLQIALMTPAEISGMVIDDRGQPIPHVNIMVSSSNGINKVDKTDKDGRFKMQQSPGDIQIKISRNLPGYEVYVDDRDIDIDNDEINFREFSVKAGESKIVDPFVVKRMSGIEITVIDEDGQPVSGAEVSLLSNPGSSGHAPNGNPEKTVEAGTCNLMPATKPTPSSIAIAKWNKGGQHFWGQELIDTEDRTAKITLRPAALASGKVTLNGNPLADVWLQLTVNVPSNLIEGLHRRQSVSFDVGNVKTDSSGEYMMVVPRQNVPGNQAEIFVDVRNGVPNTQALGTNRKMQFDGVGYQHDIEFVEGDQHIAGQVVDPEGKPIANLAVAIIGSALPGPQRVEPHRLYQRSWVYTDADGKFKIEGLLANQPYRVLTAPANRTLTQLFDPETAQVNSGEENLKFIVSRAEKD